jgi:hypothetical protein
MGELRLWPLRETTSRESLVAAQGARAPSAPVVEVCMEEKWPDDRRRGWLNGQREEDEGQGQMRSFSMHVCLPSNVDCSVGLLCKQKW